MADDTTTLNTVWDRLADGLSPGSYVPALAPGELEVAHFESRGGPYYIVKHRERQSYARLAPEDYFILGRIDGKRAIQEIVLDYFLEFGTFAFERVAGVISQLRANGFLA